jgi:serine/threonine-protein kinase
MGEVWRGTDLALDRRVAVKLLRPEHARDEDGIARFRAEAHHAGSLSHPNIAQVYDYGDAGPADPGYLVMEFVDGQSLAQLLDEEPLDPTRTMDIIAQAASGLAAAHGAGLVHRDIKPGNLLVSSEGLVKVTDFGIAHAAGSMPVTRTGELIGTPAYLAPERASGAPATPAADLYSLGIVAYQCLTGHVPFSGEPLAVVIAHIDQSLPPLPPSVPAGVAALIAELTSKDPAARPSCAADVAAAAGHLRAALSGSADAPVDGPVLAAAAAGTTPPGGEPNDSDGAGEGDDPGAADNSPTLLGRAARAGLLVGGIGAASFIGWTLATTPASAPAGQAPVTPPTISRSANPHDIAARHPGVANHITGAGAGQIAARPPGQTTGTRPSVQALTPSSAVATPSASATVPSRTPTPTPSSTPSSTPTPTPTPSSTPSSTPTPTVSSGSGAATSPLTSGPAGPGSGHATLVGVPNRPVVLLGMAL